MTWPAISGRLCRGRADDVPSADDIEAAVILHQSLVELRADGAHDQRGVGNSAHDNISVGHQT